MFKEMTRHCCYFLYFLAVSCEELRDLCLEEKKDILLGRKLKMCNFLWEAVFEFHIDILVEEGWGMSLNKLVLSVSGYTLVLGLEKCKLLAEQKNYLSVAKVLPW